VAGSAEVPHEAKFSQQLISEIHGQDRVIPLSAGKLDGARLSRRGGILSPARKMYTAGLAGLGSCCRPGVGPRQAIDIAEKMP